MRSADQEGVSIFCVFSEKLDLSVFVNFCFYFTLRLSNVQIQRRQKPTSKLKIKNLQIPARTVFKFRFKSLSTLLWFKV